MFILFCFLGAKPSFAGQACESDIQRASQCLQSLEGQLNNAVPELFLSAFPVLFELKKTLAEYHQKVITQSDDYSFDELRELVLSCERFDAGFERPVRYQDQDDLNKMCSQKNVEDCQGISAENCKRLPNERSVERCLISIEPCLIRRVQEEYSGFSLWPSDIGKKKEAQVSFHKEIASHVTTLLLAKQSMYRVMAYSAHKKLGKSESDSHYFKRLSPGKRNCGNSNLHADQENHFNYSYQDQNIIHQNFFETIGDEKLLSFSDDLSRGDYSHYMEKIKFTEDALSSICSGDLINDSILDLGRTGNSVIMSDFILDPRVASLLFNDHRFKDNTPSTLVLKATYCKYKDLRSGLDEFKTSVNWIFDGTTFVTGFLGPWGMATSTVANVGFYSALAGQAYSQHQQKIRLYEAGAVESSTVADAENHYIETLSHAAIVSALEAVAWSLPGVGKVVGRRIMSWIKNGKIASLIASGFLKITGKTLVIGEKSFSLRNLPTDTLQGLKGAFRYLNSLSLAKKIKVSVSAIADTSDEIYKRYGKEGVDSFLDFIGNKGKSGMQSISCEAFTALGAASTYAIIF